MDQNEKLKRRREGRSLTNCEKRKRPYLMATKMGESGAGMRDSGRGIWSRHLVGKESKEAFPENCRHKEEME